MGEESGSWKGPGVKRPLGKNRSRSSSTRWPVASYLIAGFTPRPQSAAHLVRGWGKEEWRSEGWGSTKKVLDFITFPL